MSLFDNIISTKKPIIIYNHKIEEDEMFNDSFYFISCRSTLVTLAVFLKSHSLTRSMNAIDSTAVDSLNKDLRFSVFYLLQSVQINTRFTLATWASEVKSVFSLSSIFPAFNWSEREIWDMFGIFIFNHPDLRRILTDYGFSGHPLRKDFPLAGFKESQYDDLIKNVESRPVEFIQAYRLMLFGSPWKGEISSNYDA